MREHSVKVRIGVDVRSFAEAMDRAVKAMELFGLSVAIVPLRRRPLIHNGRKPR